MQSDSVSVSFWMTARVQFTLAVTVTALFGAGLVLVVLGATRRSWGARAVDDLTAISAQVESSATRPGTSRTSFVGILRL